MEEYDRTIQSTDGNIIWRMRFACCLTKATNTHSGILILIALLLQQWLHESVSVFFKLQVHCLSCSLFSPKNHGRQQMFSYLR